MADTVVVHNPSPSAPKDGLRMTVHIENPEVINEWLALHPRFEAEYDKTYQKFIFEVHKYLIRVTPIDTGELRGGWTSWLDANSIDYARQMADLSIAEKAPNRDYHITAEGVDIGKTFSQYEAPTPRDITIINNVPYGLYMEVGTSKLAARNFMESTRFKAEFIWDKTIKDWFKQIESANDVVESDGIQDTAA